MSKRCKYKNRLLSLLLTFERTSARVELRGEGDLFQQLADHKVILDSDVAKVGEINKNLKKMKGGEKERERERESCITIFTQRKWRELKNIFAFPNLGLTSM